MLGILYHCWEIYQNFKESKIKSVNAIDQNLFIDSLVTFETKRFNLT